jgi:membrane protein
VIVGLFGASGVFGQLQEALNTIWGVKPKPGAGIWAFVRARFLSFAMVGSVCFFLLVSLTVKTVLRGLNDYLQTVLPEGHVLAMALFLLFDILVIVLLFAFIFRYLPDAKMVWRDVWKGSALTAVLFVLGKFILALYLGSGAAGLAYGAASSLITLLLWIYYSAQILLFGAEFTQVYANTYGSLVEPKKHVSGQGKGQPFQDRLVGLVGHTDLTHRSNVRLMVLATTSRATVRYSTQTG